LILLSVRVLVDLEKCNLCMLCVEYCPAYVFSVSSGRITVDNSKCIECYGCIPLCPRSAIRIAVEPGDLTMFLKEK